MSDRYAEVVREPILVLEGPQMLVDAAHEAGLLAKLAKRGASRSLTGFHAASREHALVPAFAVSSDDEDVLVVQSDRRCAVRPHEAHPRGSPTVISGHTPPEGSPTRSTVEPGWDWISMVPL